MRTLTIPTVVLLSACALAQVGNDLQQHWNYDAKAPLEIQEAGVQHRGDVDVHDISYASPKGGRVPAYLVVPKGKGPFAAVLWGHWYWPTSEYTNRKEFLEEAVVLAHSGVVSLLISGPIARPGYEAPPSPFTPAGTDYLVQEVVDMRRGADLLLERKDVDRKRIAYVGHSYNGSVGGILSAVDRRFAAYVLMAAPLSNEVDRKTSVYLKLRDQIGPEKFDGIMAKYAWSDPGQYVAHAAPAPMFLQFATQENFLTPDVVKQYFANVSEPKKIKFYIAPHALNAEARRDRITFLAEQLKIKAPAITAVAAVPELPQPEK